MLKFVKHHMEGIEGISIYPILSLLIFFIFFTALFWWVLTAKKDYVNRVSSIPFDNTKIEEDEQ